MERASFRRNRNAVSLERNRRCVLPKNNAGMNLRLLSIHIHHVHVHFNIGPQYPFFCEPLTLAGQPPTIRVIHETLVKSMEQNGYDVSRPMPGIAIHYLSATGIERNLQWNLKFSDPCL
jgi:hypothetical protein